MRKIIQRKIYYKCKVCHREQAVIIGLGAAKKFVFNSETRVSEHVGYHPTYKIWMCLICRSVYKVVGTYLSYIVKIRVSRWSGKPMFAPTTERIKEAIRDQCNLREVIEFEKENSPNV